MTNQKPKVSVVIVNLNRKKDTLECLSALALSRLEGIYGQIIVIDNASKDGSLEALRALSIKTFNLRLIINGRNLGFAKANNQGILTAFAWGADYVLFVNSHLLVSQDLIKNLVSVAKEFPRAGAISPKIYFAPGFEYHEAKYKKGEAGKVIWYAGGDIDWNNILGSNHGVDDVDAGQYEKSVETDFTTGACSLLRAEALKAVGHFDEKYYMFLEDGDLSVRLKKAGWAVMYTPKAVAWQKADQSSGMKSELNDYFISRNRLYFGLKYASLGAKAALFKESLKLLLTGRKWQKLGVRDFYLMRLGKGSWK